MHAVSLPCGIWAGNVHAQAHRTEWAQADLDQSATTLLRWSCGGPAVLGGDFNTRTPALPGFESAGGHVLDHVFVHGLEACGPARVLDRGGLSDHVPVLTEIRCP